jgi:hypothetical protein
MPITMSDPATRLRSSADRTAATGVQERESRYRPTGHVMRRRQSASFTVYTARGRGSYRSYAKADSAARWVAQETGETVTIVNEGTGQSWEVSVARAPRSVVSLPPVVGLPETRTLALTA